VLSETGAQACCPRIRTHAFPGGSADIAVHSRCGFSRQSLPFAHRWPGSRSETNVDHLLPTAEQDSTRRSSPAPLVEAEQPTESRVPMDSSLGCRRLPESAGFRRLAGGALGMSSNWSPRCVTRPELAARGPVATVLAAEVASIQTVASVEWLEPCAGRRRYRGTRPFGRCNCAPLRPCDMGHILMRYGHGRHSRLGSRLLALALPRSPTTLTLGVLQSPLLAFRVTARCLFLAFTAALLRALRRAEAMLSVAGPAEEDQSLAARTEEHPVVCPRWTASVARHCGDLRHAGLPGNSIATNLTWLPATVASNLAATAGRRTEGTRSKS
jgi:hypothetical protein